MRAREFIIERDIPANLKDIPDDHSSSLKGALSIPDISQNKANGNSYMQYRFGIALAGAPDYPTKASGAFAGDPLLSTYTDAELEMINAAAKMVGAKQIKKLSSNRSEELSNTGVVSPVAQWMKPTKASKKVKKKK